MAEKEKSSEQATPIEELTQRIEVLEKNDKETWGMLGQLIDYINLTAAQRKEQNDQIIKGLYESNLAERYNTQQLQMHRGNTEVHFSDKERNTNRYNKYTL